MRKPNDDFTPAEYQAMAEEYNRLRSFLPWDDEILAMAVELRQMTGMLVSVYEYFELEPPAIDHGHCYWLAQEPEVYAEIERVAGRPLSDAAHRLLEKHGLE